MRFGLKIGSGDLRLSFVKFVVFLAEGHKVRIQVFYRGRDGHKELACHDREDCGATEQDAVMEQQPQMAGRN